MFGRIFATLSIRGSTDNSNNNEKSNTTRFKALKTVNCRSEKEESKIITITKNNYVID